MKFKIFTIILDVCVVISIILLIFALDIALKSVTNPQPVSTLKYNTDGCYAEILINGVQTWCAKHCTPEEATQELDCQ